MYLKKLAVISCFNCNFTHTFMPSSLQYFELVQTFNILRVPAFKLCVLTSRAKVVQKWKGYKFVILCLRERFIMFGTCRTHFSSVTLWIVYCIPNSPKCTRIYYTVDLDLLLELISESEWPSDETLLLTVCFRPINSTKVTYLSFNMSL